MNSSSATKISVGVSACLLGRPVRYDGGHKRDRFVTDRLTRHFAFVPVCPEQEMGLGTPRPTLRLVRGAAGEGPRLVAPGSGTDHTDAASRFARNRLAQTDMAGLRGYILTAKSPTCGLERVRVYGASGGAPSRDGRGVFTAALMRRYPLLPVEESGRLNDNKLREHFIERVFAFDRLRNFFDEPWRRADLVAFHAREKCLLLAHDRVAYDMLGRLVANLKERLPEETADLYMTTFMRGISRPVTRGTQSNVLQHMAGHFKRRLDSDGRTELANVINDYRNGQIPLVVPMTLLKHFVRRFGSQYLASQSYLSPHPADLMLRNHV